MSNHQSSSNPPPDEDINKALDQAEKDGLSTDVSFSQLPSPKTTKPTSPPNTLDPLPFDELPPPTQSEIAPSDVPFEALPEPTPRSDLPPEQPASQSEKIPATVIKPPIEKSDYWLILALFLSFRGLTLFLLKPGGFIRDWSDFDTFYGIAALSDYNMFPFLDFWLEWPPLVPWLAVGSYQISLWLPVWSEDPRLWFILIFGTLFLLFEVGNITLLYRLAKRLEATQTNRALWLYMALFVPVYSMLGFFDGIALFFILFALELLLANHRFPSAITVGIGIMVKVIPILMLPIAVRRIWHQYRTTLDQRETLTEIGLYIVICGLTVTVLLAPFLIYGPQWVITSASSMLNRTPWETVWAVADGYYGFGLVNGDRLNPTETEFTAYQGTLPSWLWLMVPLLFGAFYLVIITAPANYDKPHNLIALTGLTITIFLLANKGYSPQFLVYLLPFIILLFPNGRGITYALILTGLNVLEQPIFFVFIPNSSWLLIVVVLIRFLMLLLIAAEFLLVIWPHLKQSAGAKQIYQAVPAVSGGFAAVGLLLLMPLIMMAYAEEQLARIPEATFINFVQAQAEQSTTPLAVVLNHQQTYRTMYPYLQREVALKLADGDTKYSAAPTMEILLDGVDAMWFLPIPPINSSPPGEPLVAYNFENLGLASLYHLNPNTAPPKLPIARFVGGIELVTYHIDIGTDIADVTLFWQTTSPQLNSYKVFTQILGPQEQFLAGHDGIPNNERSPTDTWPNNTIIMDRHRINLPADIPAEGVSFITGLYDSTGQRLTASSPGGLIYPNRAVMLAR